jgi:hypothetical protein
MKAPASEKLREVGIIVLQLAAVGAAIFMTENRAVREFTLRRLRNLMEQVLWT